MRLDETHERENYIPGSEKVYQDRINYHVFEYQQSKRNINRSRVDLGDIIMRIF